MMALVGRYFQKKMEKPGILECCGAVIRMEVVRAVCCGRVLKSGYALEIRDNHVGRGGEHGVVEHDLVGAASVPCSSEGTCRGKRAEHVRDGGPAWRGDGSDRADRGLVVRGGEHGGDDGGEGANLSEM